MKKFVACTFCIALVVLMVFSASGGHDSATDNLTHIAEASFNISVEGVQTDATAFLVGSFISSDGSRFSFNGQGSVTQVSQNGFAKSGTYALVQYADGSALIKFSFPGEKDAVYVFTLSSASGGFKLGDESGAVTGFTPYLA